MSSPPETTFGTDATVRIATGDDVETATTVLTRAFCNDPAMNWLECVKRENKVTDCNSTSPPILQTMERLRRFQRCIVKITMLVGGVVTLAVVPSSDEKGERVVAVSLWLKPGQTYDLPLRKALKAGAWPVAMGWGIRGLKRLFVDFTPQVEKTLLRAYKARNLDRLDSWHLFEVAVDPDWQGKGMSSLLMKDGFSRASPKSVHLEATTAKSRDIYVSFGFKIDEEYLFGKGQVDSDGLATKGAEATGYPEWVMTKVCLTLSS
ncbi:uncharacterized protein BT62DRAFT_907256 [Guyanagaster necrorhizus]|uniref:N-acetyltransferase domain-containing protein n=1 Tax=Guyanagaster necrorhizus TaxID=856835 RepID=A0A9P7VKZ2_9AGAR|nr:uncharacterized protein BT62DRAFT_907256 [Guyanagaster necrorhizus MCA 3950]KAG7441824.1 hypothetical protein BT62DRAFT_907256 [Guyanagaster necrorhizus MCA 3950]